MALACSLKGSSENPSMLIWLAKSLWEVFRPHRRFVSSYHLFGFLLLGAGSLTHSISLCRFSSVG